ncbi:MAG: TIGR01244 family sulfur transferase [Paracoccaceae bacterium]
MQIYKVTDNYSVSGQISASDVAQIKASGFNCIMCNRPDGEEFGQPTAENIRTAAENHGIKFFYVPFGHTRISQELLTEFCDVINGDHGPVFAYCRTGNRCGMLWNAAHS